MPKKPSKTVQADAADAPKRKPAKRFKFTIESLKGRLTDRRQRHHTLWDPQETGLSVLVPRGPKPRRPNSKPRPTLTFRACYYLPTAPGVPRYKVLGDRKSRRLNSSHIPLSL